MERQILQMFEANPMGITFIDLATTIEGFEGDLEIAAWGGYFKNVMVWDACSENAAAALNRLVSSGAIEIKGIKERVVAIALYNGGFLPNYPSMYEYKQNGQRYWWPSTVHKGVNYNRVYSELLSSLYRWCPASSDSEL